MSSTGVLKSLPQVPSNDQYKTPHEKREKMAAKRKLVTDLVHSTNERLAEFGEKISQIGELTEVRMNDLMQRISTLLAKQDECQKSHLLENPEPSHSESADFPVNIPKKISEQEQGVMLDMAENPVAIALPSRIFRQASPLTVDFPKDAAPIQSKQNDSQGKSGALNDTTLIQSETNHIGVTAVSANAPAQNQSVQKHSLEFEWVLLVIDAIVFLLLEWILCAGAVALFGKTPLGIMQAIAIEWIAVAAFAWHTEKKWHSVLLKLFSVVCMVGSLYVQHVAVDFLAIEQRTRLAHADTLKKNEESKEKRASNWQALFDAEKDPTRKAQYARKIDAASASAQDLPPAVSVAITEEMVSGKTDSDLAIRVLVQIFCALLGHRIQTRSRRIVQLT